MAPEPCFPKEINVTRDSHGLRAILLEGRFVICGAHFCEGLVLVWGNLANRQYLQRFSPTTPTCKTRVSAKDLTEEKAQHVVQVTPEAELQPQVTGGEGDSRRA